MLHKGEKKEELIVDRKHPKNWSVITIVQNVIKSKFNSFLFLFYFLFHLAFNCFDSISMWFRLWQSLGTKLVVALYYNFTQYIYIFFTGDEFWQIYHWITFSFYILYSCKIFRKLKINYYVINKLFKLQVFLV